MEPFGLVSLLVVILIIAAILWGIETLFPLPERFAVVLRVFGVIIVLLLLLRYVGLVRL